MIGHSPLGFSGREQNSKFRQLSQVDQSRPRCCYDVLFIKCCLFYCRCSEIQAFPKSSTFCVVKVLEINKTFLAIVRITFMFFLVRTHSWNFLQMLFSVLCDLLDESSIHDLKRGGGITSSHRGRQGQNCKYSKVMKNLYTCSSASVRFSPSSLATLLRFLNEIFPVQSSSKSRKAFSISSFVSFSLCSHQK